MSNIIKTVDSFKRKRFTGCISQELIIDAEVELGTNIAPEYKEVLREYGSLCVNGEEFLGIGHDFYDVVKATKEARESDKCFPLDVYVIENTAIDGILIVQRNSGEILSYQPNGKLQHIADNLEEYLLNIL